MIRFPVLLLAAVLVSSPMPAAELKPATMAAFDRYVRLNDEANRASFDDPSTFLWVDSPGLPDGRRQLDRLLGGDLIIERIKRQDGSRDIDIPDAIVHHWLGMVFVPQVSAKQAVALLQDYDRHASIYAPNVARSRTLSQDGDRYGIFLRFHMKRVITVVVNSEHEGRFTWHDPRRASSRIISTRIAEVEDPDTPGEKEKPVGNDGGYLWRLNSYWRFLERDGGTYVQCESITLSRGIPFGLGWIVGPFVNSIPRETLEFTLETTRRTLAGR